MCLAEEPNLAKCLRRPFLKNAIRPASSGSVIKTQGSNILMQLTPIPDGQQGAATESCILKNVLQLIVIIFKVVLSRRTDWGGICFPGRHSCPHY